MENNKLTGNSYGILGFSILCYRCNAIIQNRGFMGVSEILAIRPERNMYDPGRDFQTIS